MKYVLAIVNGDEVRLEITPELKEQLASMGDGKAVLLIELIGRLREDDTDYDIRSDHK